MSELRFDERVVVITGAGRGLGRAYAHLLAARGAAVVVNDLGGSMEGGAPDSRGAGAGDGGAGDGGADDGGAASERAPAEAVVAEIEASGGSALADTSDVATEAGASALVDAALERFGRIDALVANAGIMRWARFPDVPTDDLDAHLRVHLSGSFFTARAVWPHLVEQGGGRFVLTTSTGMLGLPGNTAYGTAKGGVIGLARSLAFAGREHDIRVNCIAPAATTRMAAGGRGPELPPEQVAPMVAYLAHEQCPVTGEILTAGGGRFARLFLGSTPGWVAAGGEPTPEDVAAHWTQIIDDSEHTVPADLMAWSTDFLAHLRPDR